MEAKDGSFGFDFGGVYDVITINKYIEYTIADGRKVKITFYANENKTKVTESFEAETSKFYRIAKRRLAIYHGQL